MALPVAAIHSSTTAWLSRCEQLLREIVDRYAVARAIVENRYDSEVVTNDFLYYCTTKATKSLISINLLISEGQGEDAQVLIRCSYECYLAVSTLITNPDRLDDFVEKKIGVKTGDFQYFKTPKGKTDYRRVVDMGSGEVLAFDITPQEMARLTGHPLDLAVHSPLYGFLSEHCHVHMMASGNYRDESNRYTCKSEYQSLPAAVYATYVYSLLLGELNRFCHPGPHLVERQMSIIRAGVEILHVAFEKLAFEPPLDVMPAHMCARLGLLLLAKEQS